MPLPMPPGLPHLPFVDVGGSWVPSRCRASPGAEGQRGHRSSAAAGSELEACMAPGSLRGWPGSEFRIRSLPFPPGSFCQCFGVGSRGKTGCHVPVPGGGVGVAQLQWGQALTALCSRSVSTPEMAVLQPRSKKGHWGPGTHTWAYTDPQLPSMGGAERTNRTLRGDTALPTPQAGRGRAAGSQGKAE